MSAMCNKAQGGEHMAQSVRILRLPDVKSRVGLSRSTIYSRIAAGRFPRPVALGGRVVGWIEAEIHDWLDDQVAASRNGDRQES